MRYIVSLETGIVAFGLAIWTNVRYKESYEIMREWVENCCLSGQNKITFTCGDSRITYLIKSERIEEKIEK